MAVSENKIRIKVTLDRELAKVLKAEADDLGTTRSEMIADILIKRYEKSGKFEKPEEK